MKTAIGFLLAALFATAAMAAPTVGSLAANPASIKAGVSTSVTLTVPISGGTVLASGANLLNQTAAGATIGILGVMHDDGKAGDAVANDGIYTLVVPFNPAQPGTIYLQASTAFKGVLSRVKSPILPLSVASLSGPPTITDFRPKSGPIGTLVSVTLGNFTLVPNTTPQVIVSAQNGNTISVSASTFSAATLSFVVPAGAASGKFSISFGTQTAASSNPFAISTSASFTLSVGPSVASLIQGQSTTYAVKLNSTNGFNGLAALSLAGAPSGIQAAFKPPQITASQTAILTLSAPAAQPASSSTLTLNASATIDGQPVSQSATATLQIAGVSTSFLGRTVVSDNMQTPIAGVTVKFLGLDGSGHTTGCAGQTSSDASGNFALTNLPVPACVGPQLISYNGLTATSPAGKYAGVNLVYTLNAGQVTTSPVLIRLPRIDNAETVQVKQNSPVDQVFTFQTMPGLALTVYQGTIFTLEDGSRPDPFPLVGINVPVDRLPDKMPSSALVTPFIVAFQPANAYSSQPVAVNYPNLLNVGPGSHASLMTLDPTRGFMVPYGTGTVSADSLQVLADADPSHSGHSYGLIHFDWHGPAETPPAKNRCPECVPTPQPTCPRGAAPSACASTASPIDLASGLEVLEDTDLKVSNARGSLSLVRTYRTQNPNPGPFGIGTGHNYLYELDTLTPQSANVVNLFFPDGSSFPFTRVNPQQLANNKIPMLLGAVMTPNADSTTDLRWKDGTIYHFIPIAQQINSGSFLASIIDPNGNTTSISWSTPPLAHVTQVADPVGRFLIFTYDAVSRITSVADPIGRTFKYAYNAQGTLESVTDPEGGVTQYEYDPENRVKKITDAKKIVTVQNVYDKNGAVIQQTQADGGVTNFSYTLQDFDNGNSFNLLTVVTDPLGNSTIYRFDSSGFLEDVTDASGQSRNFRRAPGTNLISSITGAGTCDTCGDPSKGDLTFTYDVAGNRTSVTDALGNKTSYTYDPVFNKITSVTDPLGNVTASDYDPKGNLKSIKDPNGHTTTFTYDAFGELTAIEDELKNVTTLDYDFGNLTTITDPLKNKTHIAVDPDSRPIQVTDALGRTSSTTYDNLNRIVSQTNAQNAITKFVYDENSNLLSLTDAKGNKTGFTYDSMNRLSTRTDPLSHSDSRQYDFNSNLLKFVDRRGQASVFSYDALNRVKNETYDDGSSVSRTYDANGRTVNVMDSLSGSFDFVYDRIGRQLSSATQFGTVQYSYDTASRLNSRQVVGQSVVQYKYDKASNLQSVAMPQAAANFLYDANNRLSNISRLNNVSSQYIYDNASNLLSITHSGGQGVNIPLTYRYDATGNRTQYSTPIGQALATQQATSIYNQDNELNLSTNALGRTSFVYDANGNLTSATSATGVTTYTWDTRNRLTSVVQPNGQSTKLSYDARRNLLQQTDAGPTLNQTQQFVLDQLTNAASISSLSGQILSVLNGLGLDQDLAVVSLNGLPEYSLKDGINSTVGTTDHIGTLVGTFTYEPFGQTIVDKTNYPFQFGGRSLILNGLYYNRARFYSTDAGRFISQDPIGFLGGDVSLYRYARNYPIGRRDPSGLSALAEIADTISSLINLIIIAPVERDLNQYARKLDTATNAAFAEDNDAIPAAITAANQAGQQLANTSQLTSMTLGANASPTPEGLLESVLDLLTDFFINRESTTTGSRSPKCRPKQ